MEQTIEYTEYSRRCRLVMLPLTLASAGFAVALEPQFNIPAIKLPAGILMIIAEVLLVYLSLYTYRRNKDSIGGIAVFGAFVLIVYNLLHILYGCMWDDRFVAMSYFGNPFYQPVFLLPFGLLLGLNEENFFVAFRYSLLYAVSFVLLYVVVRYSFQFIGLGFMIALAFAAYLPKKWRLLVLITAGMYAIAMYYTGCRAAMVRTLAGLAIFLFTYRYPVFNGKVIRIAVFCIGILLPILMVRSFVVDGFSIFEYAESQKMMLMDGEEGNSDTRTFLYEEVFADLTNNHAWLLGKGINGTYYSEYFSSAKEGGDAENRIISEVGFLNLLLKGGTIETIGYMFFLIFAIFNCFFRSDSKFMLVVGLVLSSHFVLLFVEEFMKFDAYNLMMWILVGMSFSSEYLTKEDTCFEEHFNAIFNTR